MMRRIRPAGAESEWTDASGTVRLAEVHVSPAWIGQLLTRIEDLTPARVAFLTRLGEGMIPGPETVLQEGDLLHVLARASRHGRHRGHPRPGTAPRGALMRVAIAGAGKVGRSIAAELTENGHEVMLVDKDPASVRPDSIPGAQWLVADACELAVLEKADLASCQVVIAATGDDKVNLVVSLLAKTEYGVPRVVARVNHPKNEWMFNESWGVDVAVSTPANAVGSGRGGGQCRRPRHGCSRSGRATPTWSSSPCRHPRPMWAAGSARCSWPEDVALVAILRDGRVIAPSSDDPIESGDELLFVASAESEEELQEMLSPHQV